MNNKYLLILVTLLFGLTAKSQTTETVDEYYSSAQDKTGNELKAALHAKISVHTVLSYSQVWEALKTTDQDPNNSDNVILLYTGWSYPKTNNASGNSLNTTWNREHTWAKSQGDFGTSNGPGTDIHHLRPTDTSVNSKRGNLYFDNGGSDYTDPTPFGGINGATGCKYDGDSWEPRDEVKGDVARMLFYMAVRYESSDMVDLELAEYSSSSGLHGKLSTLLQWHIDDPVDKWELDRNEKIYIEQKNRNPFINHPEYVDMIWGDDSGTGGTDEWVNLFKEDFASVTANEAISITGWTVINESGAKEWSGKDYNSNKYAQMSAYQGDASEIDWLITEAIDLSESSDVVLNFDTKDGYNKGAVLEVLVSDNFNGDQATANWVKLDAILADDAPSSGYANQFTNSGDISLSAFTGTIHIAFKYSGSTTLSTTMQVDNVVVKAKDVTLKVREKAFNNINIYPNPATNQITVSSDDVNKIKEIRIYNQLGQITKFIQQHEPNRPIDISALVNGIYVVQITNNEGQTTAQKLLIK